jgi:CRP-like cAMP-binding protein
MTSLERHLGALPEATITLCKAARPAGLHRGDFLLRAGERWQHLWLVEHGALRLYYLDRNGREANKNFFLDGAISWPITSTLLDKPVNFFVDCLENSSVWVLPIAELTETLASHANWATFQRDTLGKLLDDKMHREQSFLQTSARQRYESLLLGYPEWTDRIPLKHLASYLGITEVSLSRLRGVMGLIKG